MSASHSSSLLREGIRHLLVNDRFVCILIFLMAVALRWFFVLNNPHANGFLIYGGSPLSDGCSYTFKAISIAEGHGIPPVQQPAVRPFYPITLACLYTWLGFSLWAVTALNIVIGGFTAALIYLCGVRGLNRFCGLGAALFFTIDPSQLMQTPQAGTEPLGLLFFVASVYAALHAFETRHAASFFLSGLFIGLSNLTRTLTIFALPFYLGLVLAFVGLQERRLKIASIYIALMVIGVAIVMVPWLIRQQRMYGILSISDNIGEAFYAATSSNYKQWTPNVRRDADADGILDTIGDRYRYFMRRAWENVKREPGFYLRNIGEATWEYANTFGMRSRSTNRYSEQFSGAEKSQGVFLPFVICLIIAVSLLRDEKTFSRSSLVFLFISITLVLVYRVLPIWLTFVPIVVGSISSLRAARALPVVILTGSLVMSALGSVMFANTTLFRSILMTDWLFVFFFLAAVFFPAECLPNQSAVVSKEVWSAGASWVEGENTPFQSALSWFSQRAIWITIIVLLSFFAFSGARLIALTISNPPKKREPRLSQADKKAVLYQLQKPPFDVLPKYLSELPGSGDGANPPGSKAGDYVVEVQRFNYSYSIAANKLPPRSRPFILEPHGRTVIIFPRMDFTISGEIPSDFAGQPLIVVGIVDSGPETKPQLRRPQVTGLAIVPFNPNGKPDFTRAVCAPILNVPSARNATSAP